MEPVADASHPVPVRPESESDWGAFVDTYGRSILNWFRQSDLSGSAADALFRDVMQLIAREFVVAVGESAFRFRPWLRSAAHMAWCHLMEGRIESGKQTETEIALLLSVESHDAFLKALDAECSHQRRRELLPRVQPLADPADWEAFYRAVLEGQPAEEVAAQLRTSELAVNAASYRVSRFLQQELSRLEEKC